MIGNCPECGTIVPSRDALCADCRAALDEKFQAVRDALARNPGMDLTSLAKETGVPEKDILKFLRQGRLVARGMLKCQTCGEPIERGRMCAGCTQRLSTWVKSSEQRSSPPSVVSPSQTQMHIAGRMKERRGDYGI